MIDDMETGAVNKTAISRAQCLYFFFKYFVQSVFYKVWPQTMLPCLIP